MASSNKSKSFSDTMRKSLSKTLKSRKSTESEGSSFFKDIIKTPRSSKGDKASSKKGSARSQESTRESMKDVFQASEQQIKTPPQSDEKATVPQLKLSQLEQQTPSTPSPTPSPTAQPDAPATAAVASAAEPAAEPEPVVVEAKESAAVVSETPTPEKSSSPAPRLQPEVQPEAAPSNAARAQQAPDNAARSTQQAPSEAAPTQAPSKAAKGPIGFLLLIPALLVAGVCVVAAIPRSGKQDGSSPRQYGTSGRGALEVRNSSPWPSATWTGSRPNVLS